MRRMKPWQLKWPRPWGKMEAVKEEGVADFKRSTDYNREVLEAGQEDFTKLLLAIVRGLLTQDASPTVTTLAHKSLEVIAHTMPSTEMTPVQQRTSGGVWW